jgi:hypothetical protein
LHCLSPLVERHFITDMPGLILALDEMAKDASSKRKLIDRHIAAFIAVRCTQISDQWLRPLAEPEGSQGFVIGVLKIYALVQQVSNVDQVPNLTEYVGSSLKPVMSSFHNLKLRRRMEQELERASKTGRLAELLAMVNDPQLFDRDEKGYGVAAQNYTRTAQQIQQLHQENDNREFTAKEIGEQVAAIASGGIASVIAAIILAIYFL